MSSFTYDDLCIATLMFEQGAYNCKFDLKSGYHHVGTCLGIGMMKSTTMFSESSPLDHPQPVTHSATGRILVW